MSPGEWVLSGPVGDFVSAKTVYGVLRVAYAYELKDNNGNICITTLNADYANDTVTQIGSYQSNATHVWTMFKDTTQIIDLATTVNSNDNVTFLLVPSDNASDAYFDQFNDAVCAYTFPVTFSGVNTIFNGSVTYSSGMTGLGALDAASGNNTTFTYNVTYPYGTYAWLNHINGISMNYTKSGYGWGILLNNNWTPALNLFTVSPNDTLAIWMLPSADAGNFNGTVVGENQAQYANGYYVDGVVDKVTIYI